MRILPYLLVAVVSVSTLSQVSAKRRKAGKPSGEVAKKSPGGAVPYPGNEAIRASSCRKHMGCSEKSFLKKLACKLFCIGRKRFWQKCNKGENKPRYCGNDTADIIESVYKGSTDIAGKVVKALMSRLSSVFGKRDLDAEYSDHIMATLEYMDDRGILN